MAVTFKGSPVTVLREAIAEDQNVAGQVLVRLTDGTEKFVPKSELSDSNMIEHGGVVIESSKIFPDRRPDRSRRASPPTRRKK